MENGEWRKKGSPKNRKIFWGKKKGSPKNRKIFWGKEQGSLKNRRFFGAKIHSLSVAIILLGFKSNSNASSIDLHTISELTTALELAPSFSITHTPISEAFSISESLLPFPIAKTFFNSFTNSSFSFV